MDFIDLIRALASRIAATKDIIQTEEATKNAMVMPFLQALGYNVFDPHEVTPELVADIGTKKGEKIDYAILQDGKPIILIECKRCGGDLRIEHASQLFRYFHVTSARFGVLTNGLAYRFFTDLEHPNKMDETPFFEFNILDFNDRDIEELRKFAKTAFDVDTILNTATELKYTRAIKNQLASWMQSPSDEFVRLASASVLGSRRFTGPIKDQFTSITRRAFEQLISEKIQDRLKVAMTPEIVEPRLQIAAQQSATNEIVTTQQEIEGLHIVKAILRDTVSPKRIFMRDAQSYCAVLLDDNNRKTICRLRFNNTEKLCLGIFRSNKEEERISLDSIDDLFDHADALKATVGQHLAGPL